MSKRILALVFFIISTHFSYAEWKTDIADYFGSKKNYKGAIDYLINHFEKIDEFYKPEVCGLVAYSFSKLNNKLNEHKWLIKYFETYDGRATQFNFLDDFTDADISLYMKSWKRKYPWISEIALIKSSTSSSSFPPGKLPIGIDIKNDAYYRLSSKKDVIRGGLLKRGFNTLSVKTDDFFEKSGTHIFFLDLKTGDLILRKEIEINIQLDSYIIVKKAAEKTKDIEYRLSMFIGDQLIASSKKLHTDNLSLKLKPPPLPDHYGPDYPLKKDDPFRHSFSILDAAAGAVAGIYKLLKKSDTEKSGKKQKIFIQKQKQITTTFLRRNLEGMEKEVKAIITLKTKTSKVPS